MKKAILFFGLVVGLLSITSCTTDDLNQDLNNSNIQFEEEINQSIYQRDLDTIIVQPTTNTSQAIDGDPIVKPKNG